jgi:hypothetical protein
MDRTDTALSAFERAYGTALSEALVLRAKAAAWDFLAAHPSPDPVRGATLGEYLDAARAYARDETGVDPAAEAEGAGA